MSTFSRVIALFAVSAAGMLTTLQADAEKIVAAAGTATSGAYEHCFDRDYGQVSSNCTGTQTRFHVGVRTITGTRSYKATGCSSTSGQVTSCAIIVDDFTGWIKNASGDVQLTTTCPQVPPSSSGTSLGSFAPASSDSVHFECLLWGSSSHPSTTDWVGTLDY